MAAQNCKASMSPYSGVEPVLYCFVRAARISLPRDISMAFSMNIKIDFKRGSIFSRKCLSLNPSRLFPIAYSNACVRSVKVMLAIVSIETKGVEDERERACLILLLFPLAPGFDLLSLPVSNVPPLGIAVNKEEEVSIPKANRTCSAIDEIVLNHPLLVSHNSFRRRSRPPANGRIGDNASVTDDIAAVPKPTVCCDLSEACCAELPNLDGCA
mmetsp:Transcript_30800/g.43724  ORF Transcript_30800/g.43724 Transcript_30800/m.43724 type:complete len:213 (-) Transcript_30800:265-903(-)